MDQFTVDPADGRPPYEQLRIQIAARIADGRLPPGTRLPTVRALAADLGLAVNTVAKTYRALETDGSVVTEGRRGTFVPVGSGRAERGGGRRPRRRTSPSPAGSAWASPRRRGWSSGTGDATRVEVSWSNGIDLGGSP